MAGKERVEKPKVPADWEVFPGVWLRQASPEDEWVEVTLPQADIDKINETAERTLPDYYADLEKNNPSFMASARQAYASMDEIAKKNPAIRQLNEKLRIFYLEGVLNMYKLALALDKKRALIKEEDFAAKASINERLFGLAISGRLKFKPDDS